MNEEKTKIKMDDGVTRFFTRFVYLFSLSPFLTGRMFVRRTYFGQFDEL